MADDRMLSEKWEEMVSWNGGRWRKLMEDSKKSLHPSPRRIILLDCNQSISIKRLTFKFRCWMSLGVPASSRVLSENGPERTQGQHGNVGEADDGK